MHNKALIGIIVISLVIAVSTLTRGHQWGDDFASYIMQAESILNGKTDEFVEHNSFTIFESSNQIGPVAYPWGYPLLLTPAYALKGNHPLTLKLVGLIFYAGFLVCLYLLLQTRLSSTMSLLGTALFAFNPMLLGFLDHIISDIPFLFFSTVALLLMTWDGIPARFRYPAFGIALAGAFFIRATGILLLASFLTIQAINFWKEKAAREPTRRLIHETLIVLATFGILWIFYALVFPGGGESYFAQYKDFQFATVLEFMNNYFQLFSLFFGEGLFWKTLYYILIPFFLIGCWKQGKQDMFFLLFFVFWMIVLVTWPSWQGPRFVFPLLPIFIYFTFVGMKFVLEKLPGKYGQWAFYGFWSVLVLVFLFTSASNAYGNLQNDRSINGPYDSFSKEVYKYIKEETPADSIVVFFKPRAMRLMTRHDSFLSTDCEGIMKGDILVLSKKAGENQQVPPDKIDACNIPLDQVLSNNRFIVYTIQH